MDSNARRPRGGACAWPLALAPMLVALSAPGWADLVLRQRASGFPGTGAPRSVEQVVRVQGGRLRMDDADGARSVIVDLGAERVVELDHGERAWRVTPFSEFRGWRERRRRSRSRLLEGLRETRDPAERARLAEELGVPLDGVWRVATEPVAGPRVVAGHLCQGWSVRENGRETVEVWATDELAPLERLTDFVGGLGLLEEPMAEALAALPGLPLRVRLDLGEEMHEASFLAEALSVEAEGVVGEGAFQVPETYTERREAPEEGTPAPCEACGGPCPDDTPQALRMRYRGRWILFCSEACKELFRRE